MLNVLLPDPKKDDRRDTADTVPQRTAECNGILAGHALSDKFPVSEIGTIPWENTEIAIRQLTESKIAILHLIHWLEIYVVVAAREE